MASRDWCLEGRQLCTRLFFAVFTVVVAFLLTGCDPGHTLTYRNDSAQTVTVSRDTTEIVVLGPHEQRRFSTLEFVGEETFEARDESGQVIYSETLTWDDLKRRGWTIVITESALAPASPAPGPSESPSRLSRESVPDDTLRRVTRLPLVLSPSNHERLDGR